MINEINEITRIQEKLKSKPIEDGNMDVIREKLKLSAIKRQMIVRRLNGTFEIE